MENPRCVLPSLLSPSLRLRPVCPRLPTMTAAVVVGSDRAQVGPRPGYLVDAMSEGPLKKKLQKCLDDDFRASDWSIGHRGAALQFPEHTKESYVAAARTGAGILECDVTFTADGELVCRHAQCDLHTTTDILLRPELAAKCQQDFVPATLDSDGNVVTSASARCCTSDLTVVEYKSLCGKMDAADRSATTREAYVGGTADFRTDLYTTCGTVLTHPESIDLFEDLGRKFTPELKGGVATDITKVFGSQEAYAQAMIDDYKDAGIPASDVWAQSFNLDDVVYWVNEEPAFGKQAVFLDGGPIPRPDPAPFLKDLAKKGVQIVAPPMPALVTVKGGKIVESEYAKAARRADLDVISWTTERSGRIVEDVLVGGSTFYYQTTLDALYNDGDILTTIDVLAQDVGIIGLFSDWPATTTFYANCMGLFPERAARWRRRRRRRRQRRLATWGARLSPESDQGEVGAVRVSGDGEVHGVITSVIGEACNVGNARPYTARQQISTIRRCLDAIGAVAAFLASREFEIVYACDG